MRAVAVATVQKEAAPDVNSASIFALACPSVGLLERCAPKGSQRLHGEEDECESSEPEGTVERIGKFVADRTKPRPVRLVFSSLIYKHSGERSIVRVVGIFFVADISSYQHSDLVTNIVYNAF